MEQVCAQVMTTAIDRAVDAFRATLLEQHALVGADAGDAAEVGRRAALLVGGATAWREHLGELLDLRQVIDVLGVTTRQAVYDLVARHRLLGLPRQGGGMAFPAFQFNADSGRPYDVMPSVLCQFAAAEVDPYTVATWLATRQEDLDGRSPASLFADPAAAEQIRAASKRAASGLSH
jgi:hypothetical protein